MKNEKLNFRNFIKNLQFGYDIWISELLRVVGTLIVDIGDINLFDTRSDTWVIIRFLDKIIWNNIEVIIGIGFIIFEVLK